MTSYNARVAQWLKTQSLEKGTQANYSSKHKTADTGTHSDKKVRESESGSFEKAAAASTASTGTHSSAPSHAAADQGGYDQGGYDQGGYEQQGGYEDQGYDQGGY
jgi:uncharacterized membrane protein